MACMPCCRQACRALLSGCRGILQEDGTMVLLDFGQCKADRQRGARCLPRESWL